MSSSLNTPPLTIPELLKEIEKRAGIVDTYILVRELDCYLPIWNYPSYRPNIRIKIYLSSSDGEAAYVAQVSHSIKTPLITEPYITSHTVGYSEMQVFDQVVSSMRQIIQEAVQAGGVPDDSWLVSNDKF